VKVVAPGFLKLCRNQSAEADPDDQRSGIDLKLSQEIDRSFRSLLFLFAPMRQGRTHIAGFRERGL
jgi:hypothetical protein